MLTPVLLQIWAIATGVAAISGPFGTFVALSFWERLAYWGAVTAAAIGVAVLCRLGWRLVLGEGRGWVEDLAVVVSFSAILGPVVAGLSNRSWTSSGASVNWLFVSAVAALIAVSSILLRQVLGTTSEGNELQMDRLLARLDVEKGARLARLTSDNHYVCIVLTDGTEHRLLMRLRDAVEEIDLEPGFCVHRSHWVAKAAIAEVVTRKGREHVRLRCGTLIPVGPKYRDNLVRAGVLSA